MVAFLVRYQKVPSIDLPPTLVGRDRSLSSGHHWRRVDNRTVLLRRVWADLFRDLKAIKARGKAVT